MGSPQCLTLLLCINVNCVAPGQMNTARAAGRSERAPVSNVPMGFPRFSGHFHLASKPPLELGRADVTQR